MDKRVTVFRPDLAAESLIGQVQAPRYAAATDFCVRDELAPLLRAPRPDAPRDSEMLFGETFAVYDTDEEGWCWGQSLTDLYVGYIARNALGPVQAASYRVSALRSYVYPIASIKAPPVRALSMNALLAPWRGGDAAQNREAQNGEAQNGDFLRLEDGFYVWARHVARLDQPEADFVAVAERFLGLPYLWGGKSSLGLDCSALVQSALAACGHGAPRDSDMQEAALGQEVRGSLRRGDLIFWKGHVGIMQSETQLLHANGFSMSVASEPLAEASARIAAKGGGPVTSRKRLEFQGSAP